MAKWNSFKWSDGTKWADGITGPAHATAFTDAIFSRLGIRITQNTPPNALFPPTVLTASAEVEPIRQKPAQYEAFIDRNEVIRFISSRLRQVSSASDTIELTTEDGSIITTEAGDSITVEIFLPFALDSMWLYTNQRSRLQPTG